MGALPRACRRVACLWSETVTAGRVQPVVPDGCVDLIWGPGGPQVAGPDTGPHPVRMVPGDRYFGIRFRPGAVGDLFGVPMEAIRDQRVPLADLPAFDLRGPADLERATAIRLGERPGPDPAAAAIARALRTGGKVGEVASDLGLSERQLLRRCLTAFGYGPKTVQRVTRFQRALRLAGAGGSLAQVAVACGYADQAHMSNEVRRLAGMPLGQLLSRP